MAEEIRRNSPRPVSASRLAEKFEVSKRTIERDLVVLRSAGLPLYATEGRNGGHAVLGVGTRTLFTLSAREIAGLLLAARAGEDHPFTDAAARAADRLVDALPEPTRMEVADLAAKLRTARIGTSSGSRWRRVIEEAVAESRVVNITYRDRHGRVTRRAVEAVGFYGSGSGWFLIGWCRLRRDRRIFRLDRVEQADLTSEVVPRRDVDETLGWVPGVVCTPL